MSKLAGVLAVAVWLAGAGAAVAQGSASLGQAMPDSNMGAPSGNTGAANNGIGDQGSLAGNEGSHSSTATGAAAAAKILTSPTPAAKPAGDAKENDPALGGGQQR